MDIIKAIKCNILIVFILLNLFGCSQISMFANKPKLYEETENKFIPQNINEQTIEQAKKYITDKNFDLAYDTLMPLANDGNAEAQYGIGYMYYYGKGMQPNKEAGIFWIKKSADNGFLKAKEAMQLINTQIGTEKAKEEKLRKECATLQD